MPTRELDVAGLSICGISLMTGLCPFPLFVGMLSFGLDPFNVCLRQVWQSDSIVFQSIRLFMLPTFIDACCGFNIAMCGLVVLTYCGLSCGNHLFVLTNMLNRGMAFQLRSKVYLDTLHIVLNTIDEFTSPFCFLLHFVGLVYMMGVSFIVVRLRNEIPVILWLTFVSLLLITLMTISVMMPMICEIYELSKEGKETRRREGLRILQGWELKHFLKCSKARLPCRLYSGIFGYPFYFNESSTKIAYYETIFGNVVNVILF